MKYTAKHHWKKPSNLPTARQLHLPFTPFSIDLFGVPRYPFCQTKTDNNPVGFNLGDMHEEGLLQQMY